MSKELKRLYRAYFMNVRVAGCIGQMVGVNKSVIVLFQDGACMELKPNKESTAKGGN